MDILNLINVALGLLILAFGRSLYWLFVAAVGFIVGAELAQLVLANQPVWVQLLSALLAGGAGALLSVFAQRIAFGIAGFYGAGYLGLIAAQMAGFDASAQLLIALVTALIGALIAVYVMDWAIVLLSCLVGAAVIAANLPLNPTWTAVVFVLLAVIGASIQGARLQRPRGRMRDHYSP